MPLRFINPNIHVILVHYPLGVFVLGVVLELAGFLWRRSSLRGAARWMIVLGALLSLPAATSGMAALKDVKAQGITDARYQMLRLHVIYMGCASIVAVICAVVELGASDRWRKILYLPLLLAVVVAWGLMVLGAWNGGETVYRQGTAVVVRKSVAPSERPDVPDIASDVAQKKVDFETQIRPIIAANCYQCHAGDKDKGRLKLDTVANFKKGGKKKGLKGLVPHNPNASELYKRVILPKDDDDVMPQEGKGGEHLTQVQADLLKTWIAQGAEFGDWKEDKDIKTAMADARAALNLAELHAPPSVGVGVAGMEEPPHAPLKTALMNRDWEELMTFYAGGEFQQHMILAGFAFAAALFALGLSIRRLHSTGVATERLLLAGPTLAPGERRRVAEDETMVRTFNPRAAVADAPPVNRIPSGRLWLVAAMAIIGTMSLGYWCAAGSQHVFNAEGWKGFINLVTPDDPAVKLNRAGAHVVLGGSFLVLTLLCALLAAFAPRRPVALGICALLLVAVIAAQTWMGVLLTFDKPGSVDASLTHFQTDAEAKAQKEREAPNGASHAPAPTFTPGTTEPPAPITVPTTTESPTTAPAAS